MNADILIRTTQVLADNFQSLNLELGLEVQGRHYDYTNTSELGHLCGMPSARAGLAAWLCFVASETCDIPEGTWEEAAAEALELEEPECSILFAPVPPARAGESRERHHYTTAVQRLNEVLALSLQPSLDDLLELRDVLSEARRVLERAEKLSERLSLTFEHNGQNTDAHICDAGAKLASASIAIREEVQRARNRSDSRKRSA